MSKGPVANAVSSMLGALVADPLREGLKETPSRVERYFQEMTSGYCQFPDRVLKSFGDGAENYDEMIFEGGIAFYSMCEHHLVPFFGVAHIGYIPNGKVVGLSKLPRLVEIFAKRLQVQERMTTQIAAAISEHLKPKGVGVVLKARHLCMEARGVKKPGTITYTSSLLGAIRDGARSEFLKFVELADQRTPNL